MKRGTMQLDSETGKASGEIVIDVTSGMAELDVRAMPVPATS